MIVSCKVVLSVNRPSELFTATDFRVIAAAYKSLQGRIGVTQVDAVSTQGAPYFVVTLDDAAGTIPLTRLAASLEQLDSVHVLFAHEGGIKAALVVLQFEVIA